MKGRKKKRSNFEAFLKKATLVLTVIGLLITALDKLLDLILKLVNLN